MLLAFCSLMIFLIVANNDYAAPGDIVYGELISENADQITINTQPCAAKPRNETIPAPFRATKQGNQTCPGKNGRTYMKVQVEQLRPNPQSDKPKDGGSND